MYAGGRYSDVRSRVSDGNCNSDLLVLDTEKGEILGTLCTSLLLSSSSSASSGATIPASSSGHARCVSIFCIDIDMESKDASNEDNSDSVHLFNICLVSACGDMVAVECSLASKADISSNSDEGKVGGDNEAVENENEPFEIRCKILAKTADFSNGGKNKGLTVEVDDAVWLSRHNAVFLAVSACVPKGVAVTSSQLYIKNYSLVRQGHSKNMWKWQEVHESIVVDTSFALGSARRDVSDFPERRTPVPVRALSITTNCLETYALVLLSTGHIVGLPLAERDVNGELCISIESSARLNHETLTQNWLTTTGNVLDDCDLNTISSSKIIASVHFLTEDTIMVVTRDGTVVAWRLGSSSSEFERCLGECDVDTLPPCLGTSVSHCVQISKEKTEAVGCGDFGVLSRIAVLRAVDSWSCQVGDVSILELVQAHTYRYLSTCTYQLIPCPIFLCCDCRCSP